MPPPKKKQTSSLGRAVIRSRFQGQKAIALDEGILHTTEVAEGPKWVKMQSITQENDLDAFLSTAALAGTDFTAERLNVKVIQNDYQNPFLISEQEEKERIVKQEANVDKLSVPRRPHWEKTMTGEEVQRNEREAFLNWRRSMATLEDEEGLLLTPFEKNLEVWRQLWRVIERSQLIVQIVDARNPMLFRSADLEKYVVEVDENKANLLLINKADFLTVKQRKKWADYFDSQGIRYTFFSAALAAQTMQEEEEERQRQELEASLKAQAARGSDDEDDSDEDVVEQAKQVEEKKDEVEKITDFLSKASLNVESEEKDDERTRLRTTTDLLDLLIEQTPVVKNENGEIEKITIGLVGYPNVGKSSTINAIIGEKRVSVSSTPGKTKHFQTIHLTPTLVLCDCPGLVFPTFSTTKADQVCNGVLPIDQLREHTGPTTLVAKRIPQNVLEATYGIRIRTVPIEDGGTGIPTSAEFCSTYAIARGYVRSSQGNPDESRAARYILKDYVNGKLLFCHPPPGIDADEFNKEINEAALKVFKKLAPTTRVPSTALNYVAPSDGSRNQSGSKTDAVDKAFFEKQLNQANVSGKQSVASSMTGGRVTLYPHQRVLTDDGKPMNRKARMALVQANLGDVGDVTSKKHKKGKKHVKVRSGAGYDYL
ncbi:uncharacterized protein EV154DRAFT_521060 [Mucor mucedo]|uniref:CP-type G domain-containing protein n=1 Tax=Mucor saturninus TaxID=64648 RepID=A0A8H7RIY9_9FUNG|nr:uncharacterized protein EV154DRAFT_521060 [Mucor mucedo]KAG2211834.1 hypothetical protein INT47_004520 [Mucor saturninus]KAI7886880.1 hypothetical protein EV154DRAFT_521060 [Mucor mucedo]